MQQKSRTQVLIDSWLSGNKECGELLVSEAYPIVFKYVASRVSITIENRQEVIEEIVSEAFIRVINDIAKFSGGSEFSTWVCGYARNCLREKWRELKRLGNLEQFDDYFYINEELIKNVFNPEKYILKLEEYQSLKLAYKDLKKEYRQILNYRLIQGLHYKDISIYMKRPIDNLESLFRRALKELKKLFLKYYLKKSKSRDGKLAQYT